MGSANDIDDVDGKVGVMMITLLPQNKLTTIPEKWMNEAIRNLTLHRDLGIPQEEEER